MNEHLAPFSKDTSHHISLSELWKAPEAAPVPQPAVASTLQAAESAWPAPPKATGPPGPSPASYVAIAGEMVDGRFFDKSEKAKADSTNENDIVLDWIFHVSLQFFLRPWMILYFQKKRQLGAAGRTANIYEPFSNMFRCLEDNMSLFQPGRPVFLNFAGLRFWVHGCHEWDGISCEGIQAGGPPHDGSN